MLLYMLTFIIFSGSESGSWSWSRSRSWTWKYDECELFDSLKRLRLGKTTGWQHRFFLTWLFYPPYGLVPVKKPRKMELAALASPKCAERTLRQKIHATDPFVYFFCPNHWRQIFVVQKPNLSIFGLLEVLLNDKRAFKIPAAKA